MSSNTQTTPALTIPPTDMCTNSWSRIAYNVSCFKFMYGFWAYPSILICCHCIHSPPNNSHIKKVSFTVLITNHTWVCSVQSPDILNGELIDIDPQLIHMILSCKSTIGCWHLPNTWRDCYSMTTDAIYKECESHWSWQVSAMATARWLQCDQTSLATQCLY